MATLTVGFGQQYATIGAAVAASHDGDVLMVQAGTYVNDSATINTKITLQGVGGMVKMAETNWLANDKGILITNTDVTIDHFEFSGAIGSSGNDAGIRYQAGNLTITNSYFHDNQNGLLSNVSTGNITISNSEFAYNGIGDGRTHNIYVGEVASFSISNSYVHDSPLGNEIKSRAFDTTITNNRIYDNNSTSSWSIDLPNGGHAVVTGNTIEQGPNAGNSNIVSFGVEGNVHTNSSLTMTNNIVVNDLTSHTTNLLYSTGDGPVTMTGTQVWGMGDLSTISEGAGVSVSGTTTLGSRPALDTSHPWGAAQASLPGAYTALGSAGNDTIQGAATADNINGGDGSNFIRGNDGNDQIQGGSGFDDINGNKGDDTCSGGGGNDWVVGGQGNDVLFGEDGDDVVYGNMGNDTVWGDGGNDFLRGGQGDDLLNGGRGDDWISGDLGNDTIWGGEGADTFSTFGTAGNSRIMDFDPSSGDRVRIEDNSSWTVAQVGSDVVIHVGSATMTLVGVQMSWLTGDWIAHA